MRTEAAWRRLVVEQALQSQRSLEDLGAPVRDRAWVKVLAEVPLGEEVFTRILLAAFTLHDWCDVARQPIGYPNSPDSDDLPGE